MNSGMDGKGFLIFYLKIKKVQIDVLKDKESIKKYFD